MKQVGSWYDGRSLKVRMEDKHKQTKELDVSELNTQQDHLTNVLEPDGTRGIVEVYAADVQRVQLGYVMPSYLRRATDSVCL